ncbi:uncharacterized protein LOC127136277 [Lathyrus oleraceus]|uniref:DUF4283 domain-containing protein n=1 Tax=Pisum sativum TaxID=3888 RepID=A0A9D5ASH5_PEA|nr:uncharacterized protein LOC127136277 [Pisum sativum]KAI5416885.1 hypothetical protein KIW84_041765 [Pisum sativum]
MPKACVKRDRLSIVISEEEYLLGVEACKHNLHGRIIWPKGTSPLKVQNFKAKLLGLWKSIGKWETTYIGKGYFEFLFSTLQDVRRVRSIISWNLSPHFLKFFPWTKDFNSALLKQSFAQVSVRIHGLSQEYWRPKIVFAIASNVGIPLCTNSTSNKCNFERPFGHFVRVLVDLDLNVDIRGDDFETGIQKKRGEDDVLEGEIGKQKKAKKQIFVQVNKGVNPVDNLFKDKEMNHLTNLEAHPSNTPSAMVNDIEKGKSIVDGNKNPLDLCVPTAIMDVDIVEDKIENVREDIEKTLALVSEVVYRIENADFIDNTQRNSDEEVPETNLELQHDLRFLNASWDNMVHRELEKQGISDIVQKYLGVDSDGFMKVKSKSKQKV